MTATEPLRVLVLGASGMLGSTVIRALVGSPGYDAIGTVRTAAAGERLPAHVQEKLRIGVDVEDVSLLARLLSQVRPSIVINCIGVVKQLKEALDPLVAIPVNSLLPHRLASLSALAGARLIHISTDCVFDGATGNYRESDHPNATDLYGRSKLLGEVDYPNAVTLRTSIIGHELGTRHGLVEWFLAQPNAVRGFRNAFFSGLPTVELARVIRDFVFTKPELRGVYHVSVAPISKYDLLALVAETYRSATSIEPDDSVKIDRSLDSSRFRAETGYSPPTWPQLIQSMHAFG